MTAATEREELAAIIDPLAWKLVANSEGHPERGAARDRILAVVDRILAAGYRRAPGWRPIETADATENGPDVLLWDDGCYIGRVWWFDDGKPVWFTGEHQVEPTHWQPLPEVLG